MYIINIENKPKTLSDCELAFLFKEIISFKEFCHYCVYMYLYLIFVHLTIIQLAARFYKLNELDTTL